MSTFHASQYFGFLSFHGNTDFTKNKIFENFWVERVIKMKGRITYIVHENELYSKIVHKLLATNLTILNCSDLYYLTLEFLISVHAN